MADAGANDGRVVSLDALRAAIGRPAIWLTILLVEVFLALGPALAWFSGPRSGIRGPGACPRARNGTTLVPGLR